MVESNFTNREIDLDSLPKHETVTFHPISVKKRNKDLIGNSIGFFILLILTAGTIIFHFFDLKLIIIFSVLGFYFILRYIDIFLRQKWYGYALRNKDILYRRGYIYTRTTVISLNRVQHSMINRSFLDRIFGLSTLKVYTAGGSGSDISIPGLLPDAAVNLNEALSKKVGEYE